MKVALTGTPGVGKTTLAALAVEAGWDVRSVGDWAAEVGAVAGRDEADDADVIDLDRMADVVAADDGPRLLLDGHLAHLLPVDEVWLIRCDPTVLGTRLAERGYRPAKVRENLEAEAMDLILQEALDGKARVIQRDGTHRRPAELFTSFTEASSGSIKGNDLEAVDWSHWL